MAASRSTSFNSKFDVFINHRGPDVKNTLASHLFYRLRDHGFTAFLDRPKMQGGHRLDSQISGAIATSSVHIAIFSPGYAESQWCLDELLQMHKREQESKATIVPVFYNVKPSDLRMRRREGSDVDYDKALRRHVDKGRCSEETIADWKKVLSDVSGLSGLELEECNGDEGELLNRVIGLVIKNVRKPQLYVAKYPTGLDEKLHDFKESVLKQQPHSGKTKVVGIVGSGGVGKTTLAKEFFNSKRSAYHQSCFLEDVRDGASLADLQNKLHQDLTSRDLRVSNIPQGMSELSLRLAGLKALVILDNIDDAKQLEALFSPLKEVLSSDSLILLTSRNRDLLSCNGVSSIYKLSGLDREHSQKLFFMHAFPEHQPGAGFEEVVTKFLDLCDGLPLSLEVLGSQLYQKELEMWEEQYQKLISKLVLPQDIQSSLKISYDCLDDQEKEIFLDIACFLIDEDKDLALRIWDGSGWQGRLNLQNLEYKCILEIDSKNRIRMHNLLRDLGRDLAGKELKETRGCHRRLWRPTDELFDPIARIQPSVRGIHRVQGISDQSVHKSQYYPAVNMSTLHLLRAEGDCLGSISQFLGSSDQLVWICWKTCPYTSLPSWIPIRNLRALQVNLCVDSQMLQDSVGDLRFEMPQLCLGELPQLKHFDLQGTKVKEVSIPSGLLPNLEHLNLSFCPELVEVGELPTTLRSLELQGSAALEKISGLPGLANLRLLDISRCNKIEELPGFEKLTLLEKLETFGCKKLNESIMKWAHPKMDKKRKREHCSLCQLSEV